MLFNKTLLYIFSVNTNIVIMQKNQHKHEYLYKIIHFIEIRKVNNLEIHFCAEFIIVIDEVEIFMLHMIMSKHCFFH